MDSAFNLYHYTGPAGIYGIISTGRLWASNIHYLNDANEFKEAIACARKHLSRTAGSFDEVERKKLLDWFDEKAEQISGLSVLVASLSEDGDSLSQWRGYCPEAGGYAVGMNSDVLSELAARQGFDLVRCRYTREEQDKLIQPLVAHFGYCPEERRDAAFENFANKLVSLAPIIKHSSFAEEREWRLVSSPFATDRDDWKVRPGRSMLIPYTELVLSWDSVHAVREVVVGPMPHQKLAGSSVCGALSKFNIEKWSVRYSQTSFQSW